MQRLEPTATLQLEDWYLARRYDPGHYATPGKAPATLHARVRNGAEEQYTDYCLGALQSPAPSCRATSDRTLVVRQGGQTLQVLLGTVCRHYAKFAASHCSPAWLESCPAELVEHSLQPKLEQP